MKRKHIYLISATLIGVGALTVALLYKPQTEVTAAVSLSQLAEHVGTGDKTCWVAVDKKVYEINGFSQWSMGRHLPAQDKAVCGRDLSGVIGESPHGKSVLGLLKVVGTLE